MEDGSMMEWKGLTDDCVRAGRTFGFDINVYEKNDGWLAFWSADFGCSDSDLDRIVNYLNTRF